MKKQNLDLNRYKERREKEKEATTGGGSASTSVPPQPPSTSHPSNPAPPRSAGDHPPNAVRKSFMPVTSGKESWMNNDVNFLSKSTSKLYPDHPPSLTEPSRKTEHKSSNAVVAGADQHRHHPSEHRHPVIPGASSTDHRHGRPPSSTNDGAAHHHASSGGGGDPSRKRPSAPISDSGPASKIGKVDHKDVDRDSKNDQRHHHRSQTKESRPKDRPTSSASSSSQQPSYRLPPLPKPEANDEINKAILNELSTGTV